MAAPAAVHADELAHAQAQQQALEQKIADQKALIAQLNNSQDRARRADLRRRKDELEGITDDLTATRARVTR